MALEAASSSASPYVRGHSDDDRKEHGFPITKFPNPVFWIQIPANEEFIVKPGAMLAFKNLEIETRLVKNCCSRFFLTEDDLLANTFRAGPQGGQILLEEDRLGQIGSQLLRNGEGMILRRGAFLASSANVEVKPEVGGISDMFSGLGGVVYMKVNVTDDTPGAVYFKTTHGVMREIPVRDGEVVSIDNNNLIGYTDGLQKTINKTGGLATALFGQEGLVCEFSGNGTVFVGSNEKSGSKA